MNLKWLILPGLVILLIITAITGKAYQSNVIEENEQRAKQQIAVAEEKRKEREQKEEEERQAIIESHKGEELSYIPMGDSLAVGAYASEENKRYVSLLSSYIEENLGYDVTLDDFSTESGTGLKDNGLINVDSVIAENPDFITIEFGTNDLNEEQAAYTEVDEFKENLSTLIEKLQDSDEPPKLLMFTTWNSGNNSKIYDQAIKEVGKEKGVEVVDIIKVWANRSDTFGPEGQDTFMGTSDNWHPNDQGHQEIAEEAYEQVYELLK